MKKTRPAVDPAQKGLLFGCLVHFYIPINDELFIPIDTRCCGADEKFLDKYSAYVFLKI